MKLTFHLHKITKNLLKLLIKSLILKYATQKIFNNSKENTQLI